MYRKKKKLKSNVHFIFLDEKQRKSEAWLSLSRKSLQVYLFMRSKTVNSIFGDDCKKDLKLPYSIIAKETALSRQQVRDALLELDSKGFIDLATQGGLRSGGYTTNIYRLSLRFFAYGTPDFKEGTMKKAENVKYKGWGAYHAKRDTNAKNRTAPVRKNAPVQITAKRRIQSTGEKNNTCNQNLRVRKSVQSIDIPCVCRQLMTQPLTC